jgi:hypothetical protein
MIRALLEDRFKLAVHRETKEMPVLALIERYLAFIREKRGSGSPLRGERGDNLTFTITP